MFVLYVNWSNITVYTFYVNNDKLGTILNAILQEKAFKLIFNHCKFWKINYTNKTFLFHTMENDKILWRSHSVTVSN